MKKIEDFSHLKPAMLDMLEDIERLRTQLLDTYQRETVFDYINSENRNTEYTKPLIINNYPVFQFAYAGPLILNEIKDEKANKNMKSYIEWCTYNLYQPEIKGTPFQNARIFIQHFYKNNIISDLDNRNHKYIIDALRLGRIIKDDSWQNISLDISGHLDNKEHIKVYIIEEKNKYDFAKYLDENKHNLKVNPFPHEMFLRFQKEEKNTNEEQSEIDEFWG